MAKKQKPKQNKPTVAESCEGILAVLKASQRQLEYLAHEHLDFSQVLRLEQEIRVGGSPERAEIQRMHLLLDARLDHVRQLRAISSLAPLSFLPSDQARIEQLRKIETPIVLETETVKADIEVPVVLDPVEPVAEVKTEKESTPDPEPLPAPLQAEKPIAPVVLKLPDPKIEKDVVPEAKKPHEPVQPESAEPSRAIPLAAAPIALSGHTDTPSSETGLSIQITPPTASETVTKASKSIAETQKNLLRIATKAHGEGQLDTAIEAYTDLLDQDATQPSALLARGRCYLEKKDYSAALSDFKRAKKIDPKDPDPWVALGDLQFARKKHAQAIEAFDQAITLESNHAQARCRRGMAHYHTGLYRQAFLDLQRAYKLDPEIPNIRRLVQLAIRKLEETT